MKTHPPSTQAGMVPDQPQLQPGSSPVLLKQFMNLQNKSPERVPLTADLRQECLCLLREFLLSTDRLIADSKFEMVANQLLDRLDQKWQAEYMTIGTNLSSLPYH